LGYGLTSNHVHLLLKVRGGGTDQLARFMQSLAGDFAQAYNVRKGRTGAFWGDRYHAVMIDAGDYLWRCLRYIDLNMVRAGVVRSPAEWDWCGYQELKGLRKRYRVIDLESLVEALAPGHGEDEVTSRYSEYVEEALRAGGLVRQPIWTESVAVGREAYVREVGAQVEGRMQMIIAPADAGAWTVKESRDAYGQFSAPKSDAKAR
jgi:putative transposase